MTVGRLTVTGRPVAVRHRAIPLTAAFGLALTLAVPGMAADAYASSSTTSAQVCPGVYAPTVTSAVPDAALNTAFATYQDLSGASHWTGGDASYSARLPDGTEAFLFADTFLGTVNPDGSRSPTISDGGTTPFVNNSFVTMGSRGMQTVTGGTVANPTALMPPPDDTHWYWTRAGMTLAGGLNVIYSEFKRTGTGAWDFAWDANVLARFAPGNLSQPYSVTALPSATGISWGAWLLRDGGYTYIYGSEDLGSVKYMHVARVSGTNLLTTWQYLAADGTWSSTESDSARLNGDSGAASVSNEFSVVKHGSVYVMLTGLALDPDIRLAYSCTPTGPFIDSTVAYVTPEMGATGTYGNANVFTYNPHEQADFGDSDTLVFSYDVNSFVNTDLYSDASIYRPRFVELTLG